MFHMSDNKMTPENGFAIISILMENAYMCTENQLITIQNLISEKYKAVYGGNLITGISQRKGSGLDDLVKYRLESAEDRLL